AVSAAKNERKRGEMRFTSRLLVRFGCGLFQDSCRSRLARRMQRTSATTRTRRRRPFMNRSHLALALCTLPWLYNCGAQPTHAQSGVKQTPAVTVETATVTTRSLPRTLILTGSLIANRESDVAADADGKIAVIDIERGTQVKKGAMLARIDAQ